MTQKNLHLINHLVIGPRPIKNQHWKFISKLKWQKLSIIDGGDRHEKSIIKYLGATIYKRAHFYGDGDSSKSAQMPKHFKASQELSDLDFFHQNLPDYPNQNMFYFGFLGGRLDHLLCNIGAWMNFLKKTQRLVIDNEIHFLKKGNHTLMIHGSMSLLALKPTFLMCTGKCQYPLSKWTKIETLSSKALSNKASGKVTIKTKGSLILIAKNYDYFEN